jgi:hypothetical protein
MDALSGPTGRAGDLAAAKLRRVAAESGVGPDDPLRPLIDALADAVASLSDAVQKIEAAAERAGAPLTEYQIRTLAHALATGSHDAVTKLVVATNRKTVMRYAGGVLALALVAAGTGVLCGWHYAEQRNADLLSWGRAAKQACQSDGLVVDHGQKVCRIALQ